MRAVSLFSGAGGMDVGFHAAGADIRRACEMDADAAATLAASSRGCEVFAGDVAAFRGMLAAGEADCIFGGPPCQGYSVAGKMDPGDPRSRLASAFLECVETVKPSIFVMENVDSLATLAKWRGAFLDITGKAGELGYGTATFVLNANDYGVPQNRRRMFMFGARGMADDGIRAPVSATLASLASPGNGGTVRDVLSRLGPAGTSSNPLTCTAAVVYARNPVMRPSPHAGMLFNGAGRVLKLDAPAPTMAASMGGNKTHVVDEAEMFGREPSFVEEYHRHLRAGGAPRTGRAPPRLRRLTLGECMAFQAFPAGHPFRGSTGKVYRQVGNAVPCRLAEAVGTAAMGLFLVTRRD